MTFRAAVITDVHYGRDHRHKLGSKAPRMMETFIKAANDSGVDAIIDLGDRVTGKDAETDREHMISYRDHFNKAAAPFFSVLGNHDLKNLSPQDNKAIMGHPDTSYTRDMGGYHLVFWNPEGKVTKRGLELEPSGIEWLRQDLKKNKKPVILFTHVPLDNLGQEGHEGISKRFFWTQGSRVRKVLEEAGNVVLVMSGHRHKNRHREINGIHYITQQSFTNQWKEHYRVPARAYTLLEATEDKLTVKLKGKYKKTYDLTPHIAPVRP